MSKISRTSREYQHTARSRTGGSSGVLYVVSVGEEYGSAPPPHLIFLAYQDTYVCLRLCITHHGRSELRMQEASGQLSHWLYKVVSKLLVFITTGVHPLETSAMKLKLTDVEEDMDSLA